MITLLLFTILLLALVGSVCSILKNDIECLNHALNRTLRAKLFPFLCVNKTSYFVPCQTHPCPRNSPFILFTPFQKFGVRSTYGNESEIRDYWKSPGPYFFLDTYVDGFQFGHFTSKLMQYYNLRLLAKECKINDEFKLIATHQTLSNINSILKRKLINVELFTSIVFPNTTLLDQYFQHKVIFAEKIDFHGHKLKDYVLSTHPICYENVITFHHFEITIVSRSVGKQWQNELYQHYAHYLHNIPLNQCYTHHRHLPISNRFNYQNLTVGIFFRKDGAGMRKILNFPIVEEVLYQHGLYNYQNLSYGGHISNLSQIFEAFSESNIIITPHSSFLKNLLIARKGTIVIELTPDPDIKNRNPFGVGLEFLDILYTVSIGHKYGNNTSSGVQRTYRDDFYVNKEIFSRDLGHALQQREQMCK
jgi:hypothetical protein